MRYIILLILVAPIMFIALLSAITEYKLGDITRRQLANKTAKLVILGLIIALSFPVYNLLSGRPILQSDDLSAITIVIIAAVVYLLYIADKQRQSIESLRKKVYELHTNISILTSEKDQK